MATTDFIAALEISSSRISGIAGKRDPLNGDLIVMAMASTAKFEAAEYIRRGHIFNIDKAAKAIDDIIIRLESQIHSQIDKVYIGTGGQSMRTVNNEVSRSVLEDTEKISEELVNEICDENRNFPISGMDILDVEPQEYRIDGTTLVADPVGVAGSSISGRFQNIVARTTLRKNLEACVDQSRTEMTDLILTPRALAAAVLNESDRRSGCALIDLGAATTTISVYKNNILRYLRVLPLGSAQITHDLAQILKVEEDEAENLKHLYGKAQALDAITADNTEAAANDSISLGDRNFSRVNISEITAARSEEILQNAWNLVKQSGYEDKLYSGIILCGGGANLSGIDDAMRRISHNEKVKIVRDPSISIRGGEGCLTHDGSQLALLGLLLMGRENCIAKPLQVEGVNPQSIIQQPVSQQSAQPTTTIPEQTPDIFAEDPEMKKLQAEKLAEKLRQEKDAAAAAKKKKQKQEKEAKDAANKNRKNIFAGLGKKIDVFATELFGEGNDSMND